MLSGRQERGAGEKGGGEKGEGERKGGVGRGGKEEVGRRGDGGGMRSSAGMNVGVAAGILMMSIKHWRAAKT